MGRKTLAYRASALSGLRSRRSLSPAEKALWAKLAQSVTPLKEQHFSEPAPNPPPTALAEVPPQRAADDAFVSVRRTKRVKGRVPPVRQPVPIEKSVVQVGSSLDSGLDSHWDRRLGRALLDPELTLDLHDCTLDQAYKRLDAGLVQARAMGVRLVLLITGKPRNMAAADRGTARGAIRATVFDWLESGNHASAIAAVRKAHPRHGGQGAIYIVLKRKR